MKIKCLIKEHVWDGCICLFCGKKRDEEHNWDGCICRRCGTVRDLQHDYHLVTERKCYTGVENNRGNGQHLDGCYGADCSQCEITCQKCLRCTKMIDS